MAHRADRACLDQARGLHHRGHVPIAEVDHIDDAARLRQCGHLRRVGVVGGQRLFAQHMLARLEKRQGRARVHRVGRDVRRGIEPAPCKRVCNRVETALDAVPGVESVERVGVHIDTADDLDIVHREIGLGMGIRHAAGANDQNADGHRNPSSPS